MEQSSAAWIRVRGVGRERLARFVAEFLTGAGYHVEETNDANASTPTSHLVADLTRPNPAVPSSLRHLEFRTSPTAGGSLLRWEAPLSLEHEAERPRALRLATELSSNLEQRVALESRGTGKTSRERAQPPFVPVGPGAGSTASRDPDGGRPTTSSGPAATESTGPLS